MFAGALVVKLTYKPAFEVKQDPKTERFYDIFIPERNLVQDLFHFSTENQLLNRLNKMFIKCQLTKSEGRHYRGF